MSEVRRRTPQLALREVFLRAAPDPKDSRAQVVGEALEYLQQGFDAHYPTGGEGLATDDSILVGDNAYAGAVETVATLNEPALVSVAARMIQAGSTEIAAGRDVRIEVWVPHLAGLLEIITEEGFERSGERVIGAIEDLDGDGRW